MKHKTLILLMLSTSVISCKDEVSVDQSPKSTTIETIAPPKHDPTMANPSNFLKDNVWVSSGINFKTGRPAIHNTITGSSVRKCRPPRNSLLTTIISSKKNFKTVAQEKTPSTLAVPEKVMSTEEDLLPCEMKVVNLDSRIKDAIDLSKHPLTGRIRHNGIEKEVRINIDFTFSYSGSSCTTKYIGGDQYSEVCFIESQHCTMYRNYIEPYIRAYYEGTNTDIEKKIIDALPTDCKTTTIS